MIESILLLKQMPYGRNTPMPVATLHAVNQHSMTNVPDGMEIAFFAMGCFWGVERLFWSLPGVYSTAAGYTGGYTPNPTYREVCSGDTGHAEAVRVVYDPHVISYEQLLQVFWENHDPAQGMRQGNDQDAVSLRHLPVNAGANRRGTGKP